MDKLMATRQIPPMSNDNSAEFAAFVATLGHEAIDDLARRAATVSAVIDWTTLRVEVHHDTTFDAYAVVATAHTAQLSTHPRPPGLQP